VWGQELPVPVGVSEWRPAANLNPLSKTQGLRILARYWVRTLWRRGPHHPARICRRDSACIPSQPSSQAEDVGSDFEVVFIVGTRSLDPSTFSSFFCT
jgi:hypothetical protein